MRIDFCLLLYDPLNVKFPSKRLHRRQIDRLTQQNMAQILLLACCQDHKCKLRDHQNISYLMLKNIILSELLSLLITFAAYNPPSPPEGSGPHRYYLFVFEQEHSLDDTAKVDSRCHFSIDDYKNDFDLTPVAMNMFRTENGEAEN